MGSRVEGHVGIGGGMRGQVGAVGNVGGSIGEQHGGTYMHVCLYA